MKVKNESEVAQSCPTLSDPMDCRLPGSSVHGIFPGKRTGVECHCLLHAYGHVYLTHLPTLKTELLFYCWIVRVSCSGYRTLPYMWFAKDFRPFCCLFYLIMSLVYKRFNFAKAWFITSVFFILGLHWSPLWHVGFSSWGVWAPECPGSAVMVLGLQSMWSL